MKQRRRITPFSPRRPMRSAGRRRRARPTAGARLRRGICCSKANYTRCARCARRSSGWSGCATRPATCGPPSPTRSPSSAQSADRAGRCRSTCGRIRARASRHGATGPARPRRAVGPRALLLLMGDAGLRIAEAGVSINSSTQDSKALCDGLSKLTSLLCSTPNQPRIVRPSITVMTYPFLPVAGVVGIVVARVGAGSEQDVAGHQASRAGPAIRLRSLAGSCPAIGAALLPFTGMTDHPTRLVAIHVRMTPAPAVLANDLHQLFALCAGALRSILPVRQSSRCRAVPAFVIDHFFLMHQCLDGGWNGAG